MVSCKAPPVPNQAGTLGCFPRSMLRRRPKELQKEIALACSSSPVAINIQGDAGGAEFTAPWQTYCRAPAQIKFTAPRLKDKLVSFREVMPLAAAKLGKPQGCRAKVRTPGGGEINRFVLFLERRH